MATMNPGMAKGRDAAGAINKYRFVKLVDTDPGDPILVAQCDTLGEKAYGVSMFSVSTAEIDKGKGVSVINDGRMILEAGAALAVGDLVMTDGVGRAVLATSGHVILGEVDADPTVNGAGDQVSVMLASGFAKVP